MMCFSFTLLIWMFLQVSQEFSGTFQKRPIPGAPPTQLLIKEEHLEGANLKKRKFVAFVVDLWHVVGVNRAMPLELAQVRLIAAI